MDRKWYLEYLDGLEMIKQGKYEKAKEYFLEAINLRSRPAANTRYTGVQRGPYIPYYYLGLACYHLGQHAVAIDRFDQELKAGEIEKLPEKALLEKYLKECREALAKAPSTGDQTEFNEYRRACDLFDGGRYPEARAILERIASGGGAQSQDAAGLLRKIQSAENLAQEAERAFKEAQDAFGKGDYPSALKACRELQAKNAAYPGLAELVASCDRSIRQARQAEKIRSLTETDPLRAELKLQELREESPDFSGIAEMATAIEAEKAKRERVSQARLTEDGAKAQAQAQVPDEREALLEKQRREAEALASLMASAYEKGDYHEAMRACDEIYQKRPDYPGLLDFRDKIRQAAKSSEQVKRALALAPADPGQAEADLRRVREEDPGFPGLEEAFRQVSIEKKRQEISITDPYYALLIGNNDYQYLPKLKSAVNDIRVLGYTLKEQYGFADVQVRENVTREKIFSLLNDCIKELPENAFLLIYYAGHGTRNKDVDQAYWLPVDARKDDDTNWVSSHDITVKLKQIPAKHVLVVSDSCYAGAMMRNIEDRAGTRQERKSYLKKMYERKSRKMMASGGEEPVLDQGGNAEAIRVRMRSTTGGGGPPVLDDQGGGGHSVFASALIEGLQTMEKQNFTAGELFDEFIKVKVGGGAKQTPLYDSLRDSADEGGEFIFVRRK